jgi:uncharacterized protein (DUF2062 family)
LKTKEDYLCGLLPMKFNKKYILNALSQALRQGTTPRQLALTFALGAVIGIFPLWGTTTWVCIGLAIVLRLNIAILQLVNYLFFPLQIVLILPFIKAGTLLFSLQPFPYTRPELIELFKTNFWGLIKEAGISMGSGIAVWALVALPLFFVIFYPALMIFNRWRNPATSAS